jgi:hypothetical protein
MSSLPDKGEKLRKQVDDIERAMSKLNKRIADMKSRSQASGEGSFNGKDVLHVLLSLNQLRLYKIHVTVQDILWLQSVNSGKCFFFCKY